MVTTKTKSEEKLHKHAEKAAKVKTKAAIYCSHSVIKEMRIQTLV